MKRAANGYEKLSQDDMIIYESGGERARFFNMENFKFGSEMS